ncbi:low affinity immunoglobulin gamma Fc region receptor II-b-like [Erpetoichthys calabaricus]|uniref:low affinity immunoglobulin gamma Fc region receptor II-b-like n=1 Tax=Erpetoichthys calabaricus TaxID=27687 RepID=UPI0022340D52|nr:low affinity immunoglobulin gamma Fc region receptor II-b-like [Erpetoichthys calabaricus]
MQAWELYLIISVTAVTPSTQNEDPPKVTLLLQTEREPVYTGDTVTLECIVEEHIDIWIHRWFKNRKPIWRETKENTHIFQSVTQSDSGEYHCDAYRWDTRDPTKASNDVILNVQERGATLKVISEHTDDQIHEGVEVHLLCMVDGDPADWSYELYKSGDESPHKTQMEKNFTIGPVTLSHKGEYKCRAARGALYSSFSDPFQLHVSASWLRVILIPVCLFLILLLLILLFCVYYRKKGSPCIRSNKSRGRENENHVPATGGESSEVNESSVQKDLLDEAGKNEEVIYSEMVDLPQNSSQGTPLVSPTTLVLYSEVRVPQCSGSTY